ncbi:putative malate aliminium toerance [Rosellinia necatrix]|uniref:Putative malate aliminium toerance n=1 Tax=Rosellinia necatrix TaxID=77044 RepID=A0A1W2TB87_ROSNE|nr:putative malate aliminium toerance [Rosellinia necatrix]
MTRGRWKPGLPRVCQRRLGEVAANLRKPSVWRPMLKNVLSTVITIIIGVIPAVVEVYGKSTYLGVMASVFSQPGQRFGRVVETLCLIILGTLLGLGWSNLGLYASSLVRDYNSDASFAIRAIFFVLAVMLHGLLRSSAPRLFQLVLFFILANLSILTGTGREVALSASKAVIYPIFTAIGVVILINITVFPQFSSGFLGRSTIKTLSETVETFQAAGDWFLSKTGDDDDEKTSSTALRKGLATLSHEKTELRARLGNCKTIQSECNFELVFAVLPPRSLKPISVTMMARLVQVTISLINACESKYAMSASDENEHLTDEHDDQYESDSSSDTGITEHQRNIALIKPIREIELGDADNLEHIMSQIRRIAKEMQDQIQDAIHLIVSALAYCYDVSQLPCGSRKPGGILLQEMDIRTEIFTEALAKFDTDSAVALESVAITMDARDLMGDIAPRMETNLVSSFLISINQAARQVLEMLKYARTLIERRQARGGHRKLYWPHIGWKKWLTSGGEEDSNVLPENARKEVRSGSGSIEDSRDTDDEGAANSADALPQSPKDEETGFKEKSLPLKGNQSREKGQRGFHGNKILWIRGLAANTVEFFQDSDHLAFALKMTIAALLVTWPAFVPSLNNWYSSVRGTWATLQLILVFEVSIGTTFLGFFLRALGTVFGCSVGLLAWEAGQGNRVVLVVVLAIGLLPASYVQLATQYVKAGTISMISLSVVGLATVVRVNDDAPWQTYVKRLVCFLVGGVVALTVEMVLYPVRARDRLVESLVTSISQISVMESSVAVGVESPSAVDTKLQALNADFKGAKDKAEQALGAARAFLPFCLTEPRIKGDFKGQALVYSEMIYVLFQIIDRMDNMLHIRRLFGSSILEELHEKIMPYRRNVAGCVTLNLFMVQEALTTRLPLPEFLPSSRVAQLRSVARVRELLLARGQGVHPPDTCDDAKIATATQEGLSIASSNAGRKLTTRQALLAWKASSAGMMEIIEYLEELVDLAKLLVGVNAFRSGLLERQTFHEYNSKLRAAAGPKSEGAANLGIAAKSENAHSTQGGGGNRRRLASFGRRSSAATQPEPFAMGLRRRQTAADAGAGPAGTGDSAFDYDGRPDRTGEHDIQWSLQRVISKRVEENRWKRRGSEGPKGKHALRSVQTWTG